MDGASSIALRLRRKGIEADLRRQALGKDETGLIMGCRWGQPEPLCAALCGSLDESGLLLSTVDEYFM
ncbi:MAG: hypothetical protein LBK73_05570 [Treponema sp.]|jgi:hypothetical protein|nr:hypothetical protein [Treponema sp.]